MLLERRLVIVDFDDHFDGFSIGSSDMTQLTPTPKGKSRINAMAVRAR